MPNYIQIIKIIFLYSIAFLLFYLEPISIGGLKFSILWKLPLVIMLGIYFYLKVGNKKQLPTFVFIGLLLAIKLFFSMSSLEYMSSTITEFTKFIIFFFLFTYLYENYNAIELDNFGRHIAIFVVVSFLPFMFNILQPLGKSIDLSKFGSVEALSYTGIFQNPHAAGISVAISSIILYYYFLKSVSLREKLIYMFLVSLGIFEMVMTFVRTPLVMFIVGVFILSMKYFRLKHYLGFLLVLSIASAYIYTKLDDNPLLRSLETRIQGENKYQSSGGIGSGRLMFWNQAIESWQSEGLPSIVLGLGLELSMDKMQEGTGFRLFAHNGFLQQLQAEGIIGFILLILFVYFLYQFIRKYKRSPYYTLLLAIYSAFIVYMFFQGGSYFLFYVIFATYLAILPKTNYERINDNAK